MQLKPRKRLIYDIETDGLLDELTKVHVLSIRDIDTRQTFCFRKNSQEDSIRKGIEMLNDAELIVGHNIIGFDNYALWKVYGDEFAPTGTMRDTLVMAQMMFADEKERDFRRWKRGELDGSLIGQHGLEAWGMRLGFPKDEYSKRCKERALDAWAESERRWKNTAEALVDGSEDGSEEAPKHPLEAQWGTLKAYTKHVTWDEWSQEMEDYGVQDLDPTEALWRKIEAITWSEEAIQLEHLITDLCARITQNGFPVEVEKCRRLEQSLRVEHDRMAHAAVEHFGKWYAADRWLTTNKSTTYVIPATGKSEKDQRAFQPRAEYGEDNSRKTWGEVSVPARSIKYKDPMSRGGDRTEGAPFCPITLKEFNPNSRPMIVDRLTKVYEWEPQEFTEKNNPVVNDEVLRDLGLRIDICIELAEIFYYKKRLGQVADGQESWLASIKADGRAHCRTNPGGTVTNRASHSKFNIAQVPRVVFKKLPQVNADGTPLLGPDGQQIIGKPVLDKDGAFVLDAEGKVKTKASLMKGREGDHGWDCRELFYVPEGWVLLGADQKGIELRALAHAMWEYDDGAYARILLEEDIHDAHQAALGLDSRDTAKTFIYAMLYGAQDYKLGCTLDPALALYPEKAKALGKQARDRLMSRFPALRKFITAVQREASRGYVIGLDGRKLFVRAKHSAPNTKLQGMGATLAKIWCVTFESLMEEEGYVHGWHGDFAILAWVHDELQIAVRDDPATIAAAQRLIREAATYSGERVGFRLPVDIDTKIGMNWAMTH